MGHGVYIGAVQSEISNKAVQSEISNKIPIVFCNCQLAPAGLDPEKKNRLRGTRPMPPATGAPVSTWPGRVGISFRSRKDNSIV